MFQVYRIFETHNSKWKVNRRVNEQDTKLCFTLVCDCEAKKYNISK